MAIRTAKFGALSEPGDSSSWIGLQGEHPKIFCCIFHSSFHVFSLLSCIVSFFLFCFFCFVFVFLFCLFFFFGGGWVGRIVDELEGKSQLRLGRTNPRWRQGRCKSHDLTLVSDTFGSKFSATAFANVQPN